MSSIEGDEVAKQKSKYLRRIRKSGSPVYDPESYHLDDDGEVATTKEARKPTPLLSDEQAASVAQNGGGEDFQAKLQALRDKQQELRSRIALRMSHSVISPPLVHKSQQDVSSTTPPTTNENQPPSFDSIAAQTNPDDVPVEVTPTISEDGSTRHTLAKDLHAGQSSSNDILTSPSSQLLDQALSGPSEVQLIDSALSEPSQVQVKDTALSEPSQVQLTDSTWLGLSQVQVTDTPLSKPSQGQLVVQPATEPMLNTVSVDEEFHGFAANSPVAMLLSRSTSLRTLARPSNHIEPVQQDDSQTSDDQARALREQVSRMGRTNQELKRMLLAAFGAALANEIASLTALKVELGDLVTQLSETNDSLETTLSEALLERDLYRTKFTAAEVMIEQLSSGEMQLSTMLDESNRQQRALQTSQAAVAHMVTDCSDLLMAIIARIARDGPVTLSLDVHETESVLDATRTHRKTGALQQLCEANLMLVGLLANSLVMKLATTEHPQDPPAETTLQLNSINFTQCCAECKGPVFYA